jgi:ERCC4-type nuclease
MKGIKTKCTLIIDTRERNVLRHAKEFEDVSYEVKQITTADYVVVRDGKIVAAIERKSLEDYAASIKDGRSDNKKKLIELRRKTGCALIYIIEGDAFPHPNACYGNIPYKFIESSIFHLTVRDRITILHSADTLGTAGLLARFVKSMDTLADKSDFTNDANMGSSNSIGTDSVGSNSIGTDSDSSNVSSDMTSIVAELTRKHIRTDHEIARELWSCFPGISVETADEYSKTWSIAEIVCEAIPRGQIQNFKLASGRKISKKVVNSLTGLTQPIEVRLLSCIEGVSTGTAKELCAERSLKTLLGYGAVGISMCKVGKSKRSFGEEKANRLIRLFNYKYVQPTTVKVPTTVQPTTPAVGAQVPTTVDTRVPTTTTPAKNTLQNIRREQQRALENVTLELTSSEICGLNDLLKDL